jgi:hypothetical protein
MNNFVVFKFPTLTSGSRTEVEHTYCELVKHYRNGILLDPEAIDWMDSANNWLKTSESSTI